MRDHFQATITIKILVIKSQTPPSCGIIYESLQSLLNSSRIKDFKYENSRRKGERRGMKKIIEFNGSCAKSRDNDLEKNTSNQDPQGKFMTKQKKKNLRNVKSRAFLNKHSKTFFYILNKYFKKTNKKKLCKQYRQKFT